MPFLDPKNDLVFKRVFGNEHRKEILIDFLNNILGKSGKELIADVSILNPHQAPHIDIARDTIVDVKCRDQAGLEYIVEMQVLPQKHFDKRVLFYASRAYSNQIPKGTDYSVHVHGGSTLPWGCSFTGTAPSLEAEALIPSACSRPP